MAAYPEGGLSQAHGLHPAGQLAGKRLASLACNSSSSASAVGVGASSSGHVLEMWSAGIAEEMS